MIWLSNYQNWWRKIKASKIEKGNSAFFPIISSSFFFGYESIDNWWFGHYPIYRVRTIVLWIEPNKFINVQAHRTGKLCVRVHQWKQQSIQVSDNCNFFFFFLDDGLRHIVDQIKSLTRQSVASPPIKKLTTYYFLKDGA